MLMMRPERAFIMPRNTALESRNTDLRLVSITASHSASFMRMARLSWAMPALLTRTDTGAYGCSIAATRSSMLVAPIQQAHGPGSVLANNPAIAHDNLALRIQERISTR